MPNSVNIPIDSLLSGSNPDYFGIPGTKVVFISNDDIKADQAWVLTKRLGFNSTYVMTGGLNQWIETIIQPQEPGEEEPVVAHEIYEFRKGAQQYFTGAKTEIEAPTKTKVEVTRRKKNSCGIGRLLNNLLI